MTPDQIRIVQRTWGELAHETDHVAEAFYMRLFQIAPGFREKFPKDLNEQYREFSQMLHLVVNGLVCFDELVPEIETLGRRHLEYGVEEPHYDLVAQALLSMLTDVLGTRFTEEARQAWAATYGRIAGVMKAAAYPRTSNSDVCAANA
jgi:hemoglobin-like flavoprotein